jgi:hypothetical protein
MKKLKIMLLSFAVLAVVGSALAFKARFAIQRYCTTATNGQASNICDASPGLLKLCPNLITKTTADAGNGIVGIFCTTDAQDVDQNPNTPLSCKDQNGQNTVQCLTTTTIYED